MSPVLAPPSRTILATGHAIPAQSTVCNELGVRFPSWQLNQTFTPDFTQEAHRRLLASPVFVANHRTKQCYLGKTAQSDAVLSGRHTGPLSR